MSYESITYSMYVIKYFNSTEARAHTYCIDEYITNSETNHIINTPVL